MLSARELSYFLRSGKPYLNIKVDRQAMARYGLSAKDVLDAVEISIGGKNVSTTIEGRERFHIQIRVQRSERDDIEKLSRILVAAKPGMSAAPATPSGGMLSTWPITYRKSNTDP